MENEKIIHDCGLCPEVKMGVDDFYDKYEDLYCCGQAISEIYYNTYHQKWVATNNEYNSIINYCPWCGVKLKI